MPEVNGRAGLGGSGLRTGKINAKMATMRFPSPLILFVLLGLAVLIGGCAIREPGPAATGERETVVLIHGLGRSTGAMWFLQQRLEAAGYETFNLEYPSTRLAPEEITALLHEQIHRCCADRKKVHFVGHSLGGLLVRALLGEKRYLNLGRVVLLGSPSRGSALVDWLEKNRLFRELAGPTARRLGTDEQALYRSLPPPDYELGVIAGTRSLNPVGSWLLAGPDDGIVSVKSTRIDGMTDFLQIPADHVLMRYSNKVADEVIHFLRTGRFSEAGVHGESGIEE